MTATHRCERRACGTVLTERQDKLTGRLEYVCLRCERIAKRNAAGLCADCPAELPSRKCQRCPACAHQRESARHLDRQNRRYRNDDQLRERKNAQRRTRRRQDPEFRAKELAAAKAKYYAKKARGETKLDAFDLAYHRAWHKAHPRTKAQNDREYRRRRQRMAADPVYRAHQLELQRARSRRRDERRRARIAAVERVECAA